MEIYGGPSSIVIVEGQVIIVVSGLNSLYSGIGLEPNRCGVQHNENKIDVSMKTCLLFYLLFLHKICSVLKNRKVPIFYIVPSYVGWIDENCANIVFQSLVIIFDW